WGYYLPDALGSIRQTTDDAGAVSGSREWTPFGVEVGAARGGLGYTGEWFDGSTEMAYLRARWFDGTVGRFTSEDPWEGEQEEPQTLHPYIYVHNNAVNLTDPSGHCASDCECFVEEVQRFIAMARTQGGGRLNDNWIVQMLGGYYAGFWVTENFLGCSVAIPPFVLWRGTTPERWRLPNPKAWQVFDKPPVEGAEEAALDYGFKRTFYNNTHHYFASFRLAWEYTPAFARYFDHRREANQLTDGENGYYDSAADILITETAIKHVNEIYWTTGANIDMLPQLLREDACGDSLEEIYAEWVWPNPVVERWLGPSPQE
ncbi:MAG: RHS repeat-associated core domain-containing protein, partial [Chloroflexi bacterium]|nr:RHS repeat-associated core domain-containing protein [Chloroflexota bacterium]